MELGTIIIIAIVVIYATKNEKGREVVNNLGDTAVHLSASASKASAALEKQCDELLMSDAEVEAVKAKTKAKLAKASKAKVVEENYDDIL